MFTDKQGKLQPIWAFVFSLHPFRRWLFLSPETSHMKPPSNIPSAANSSFASSGCFCSSEFSSGCSRSAITLKTIASRPRGCRVPVAG